jgi:hypothetical protein
VAVLVARGIRSACQASRSPALAWVGTKACRRAAVTASRSAPAQGVRLRWGQRPQARAAARARAGQPARAKAAHLPPPRPPNLLRRMLLRMAPVAAWRRAGRVARLEPSRPSCSLSFWVADGDGIDFRAPDVAPVARRQRVPMMHKGACPQPEGTAMTTWRRRHGGRGKPMPQTFWAQAVALAQQRGASATAPDSAGAVPAALCPAYPVAHRSGRRAGRGLLRDGTTSPVSLRGPRRQTGR